MSQNQRSLGLKSPSSISRQASASLSRSETNVCSFRVSYFSPRERHRARKIRGTGLLQPWENTRLKINRPSPQCNDENHRREISSQSGVLQRSGQAKPIDGFSLATWFSSWFDQELRALANQTCDASCIESFRKAPQSFSPFPPPSYQFLKGGLLGMPPAALRMPVMFLSSSFPSSHCLSLCHLRKVNLAFALHLHAVSTQLILACLLLLFPHRLFLRAVSRRSRCFA